MNIDLEDTLAEGTSENLPSFPVVGIGASAGGLEAFTQLLKHLPVNLGMAYVFIQHLDPSHESLLTELLARVTSMPVQEASDRMILRPDHVYVIPPNADLTLLDERFTIEMQENVIRPHLSIDIFFRSLAESRQNHAIGIILSGTASDGTLGLMAIKEQGGQTYVQDPDSASQSQMPQSAIKAGCANWIGTPEQIAQELSKPERQNSLQPDPILETQQDTVEQEREFQRIVYLLAQRTNVDFTVYKPATLKRRLARRMGLQQKENLAVYRAYLCDHPAEIEALYQDFLIGVTGFFRDPSMYQRLLLEILPRLVSTKSVHETLRVWVPGCSTGEEVYSLAICLQEFLAEHQLDIPLQLFGTDLNSASLAYARAGLYSSHEIRDVPAIYHDRYFRLINGRAQISKSTRDLCVFAQHNLLKDPPFSRLDLVSCRNVLIYLEPDAQYKIAQLFHYALAPQGVLLLGSSESIRIASDLFKPLGERTRSLYLKKAGSVRPLYASSVSRGTKASRGWDEEEAHLPQEEVGRKFDLQQQIDHLLLSRYAPASVVIDSQMEIMLVRGHTSPYLEAAPGRASLNLFKMAREGLGLELRVAVSKARKSGQLVRKEGVQVGDNGVLREVTVEVIPLTSSSSDLYFVILFEELSNSLSAASGLIQSEGMVAVKRGIKERRIQQLEQELSVTREEMRSAIEELEAANEELQSVNEEGLSSNEELQSLNEELETSKEELQASNEELMVINQELMLRNQQIQAARSFSDAIIATIRESLLVLNSDLRVEQSNEAFYQMFQLEPVEVEGQPLFTLARGAWNIPALRTLLEEILPQKRSLADYQVEQTFPEIGRRILLLNAQRIDGEPLILLAIEDITERRRVQENEQAMQMLKQREEFLAIASHELKTPVTSIKGYTQMLHHRFQVSGDERSANMLGKMDVQLNKLIRLIGELLDMTKIEEGKLQWHHQFFELTSLIQSIIEEMGFTQYHHQIQLENEVGSVPVFGDPERIGQVLTNLLSNAMKYSPQAQKVNILLRTNEETVTVGVQDFGIGIDPDKHTHLFERFFRLNDPAHETYPGLGLGLYISAEIVKSHRGKIWVESQPGAGSTFYFTLPLASRESLVRTLDGEAALEE